MTAALIRIIKTREQGAPPVYYFLLQYMRLSYLVETTAPRPIM